MRYILDIPYIYLREPEYAGIDMICIPHIHSNISVTAKLGVINSQFYRFLRICTSKAFFGSQMVSLSVLLKSKDHPLKILLKRTRGLLNKYNAFLEFQHLVILNDSV
jgi:hypothetical protein